MWWFPILTATVMALAIYFLQIWQRRRDVEGSRSYRAKFIQLVSKLEALSLSANQLVTYVPEINEPKILDYYESSLRVVETLLSAICKLPPFGAEPDSLNSAFFLAKDCEGRIVRMQKAFRDQLRGKTVRMDELYGRQRGTADTRGCYFCSRPFISSRFARARVRLDGEVKDVISCNICKDELEHTKKVKVLYFQKDGKQVHWSNLDDYVPSEDYWSINQKNGVRKTRQLELVHSSPATKGDGPK